MQSLEWEMPPMGDQRDGGGGGLAGGGYYTKAVLDIWLWGWLCAH